MKKIILLLLITLFFPQETEADVFDYSLISGGNNVFNVKVLGAKGDGDTDDTAVINDALNKTRYPNGGGVVYLPEGRYRVTGIDATALNGTTIIGDGPEKTFIISAGFEGSVIDTLGSNYLTIAKLTVGLEDGATADAGIVLSSTAPHEPYAPGGASSTANSIEQVNIEDSGVSSSFNIANFLITNSGDTHINNSKFISRNRATTPAVLLTGDAQASGLRSAFGTVPTPAQGADYGAGSPTDTTFMKVLIRKETAGNVGALALKGAEVRFFDSRIESADSSGVVSSDFTLNTLFYNTEIIPINQARFDDACIRLPAAIPAPNEIHVHGLSFDPRNCNSGVGPVRMQDQNWTFRLLYPPQLFTSDIKRGRGVLVDNVPHFYVADIPFPSPPPAFNSPVPSVAPSASTTLQKPGDTDGDGDVDIFDYNQVVTNFGKRQRGLGADLDKDGDVDIFDYNLVTSYFGN